MNIQNISTNPSQTLAIASSINTLNLFQIKQEQLHFLNEIKEHTCEILTVSFLTDDLVICGDRHGIVLLFSKQQEFKEVINVRICNGPVNSIVPLKSDNQLKVVCGCSDGYIRICEINNSDVAVKKEIFAHEFGVTALSSDNEYFVSGGMNYNLCLFKDDVLIKTFNDHKARINDVAFLKSFDFKYMVFASCSDDKTVIIYQAIDGDYKKQVISFGECVYGIEFSEVGMALVVTFWKNQYRCYMPDIDGVFQESKLEEIVE